MNEILIHPTALVESVNVGTGSRVWAYAHIMTGARVGKKCNIGEHCFIESGATVGDGAIIKNGNMVWEGVTIEDDVFIGPHVVFTNDLNPRSRFSPQARNRYRRKANWLVPTLVKRGSTLGAGAIILAGVTIGEYAMVGAGALIAKDVPPYAIAKGNPAQVSGWVCRCGHRITFENSAAICSECGLHLQKDICNIIIVESGK